MKNIFIKIAVLLFVISIASCSDKNENKTSDAEQTAQQMKMDNHEHQMSAASTSELTREGVIDLASIDENKDDSLYECPMDWNVIADHEGECPTCGMKLKEFSIADVQNNLTKYGYEFKK